jgi:hypothetical protein
MAMHPDLAQDYVRAERDRRMARVHARRQAAQHGPRGRGRGLRRGLADRLVQLAAHLTDEPVIALPRRS